MDAWRIRSTPSHALELGLGGKMGKGDQFEGRSDEEASYLYSARPLLESVLRKKSAQE